MPHILQSTGTWFLHSGIQEPSGGVARYYLANEKTNLPASTEITGYFLSALVYLYDRTQNVEYLDAAQLAAQFLTRKARNRDLKIIPFELGADSPAYFFDCGIIVRALLSIYNVTKKNEYLETAVECGTTMGERFRDGRNLHPIVLLPSFEPKAYEPRWSRSPGCLQLKSAVAWHNLHQIVGEAKFQIWYEHALQVALETHTSFLPGDDDPLQVMDRLHAYCYFLEGLIPVASRPECQAAFQSGLAKAGSLLREIGPRFRRSDVCAQILRARLYSGLPVDRVAAAEEAAWAKACQYTEGDKRHVNGFSFGTRDGQLMPYVNPVSTSFCMQAIYEWETGHLAPESRLI
jgi:hypothetical protein